MHGFVCCVVNERLQLIDDAINGSVCSSIVAELVADIQLYNNATDDILLSPETSTSCAVLLWPVQPAKPVASRSIIHHSLRVTGRDDTNAGRESRNIR